MWKMCQGVKLMWKTHNGSLNYYSMGCCVQVLSHRGHNVIYVTSVRHRNNFVRERSNLVNRIQKYWKQPILNWHQLPQILWEYLDVQCSRRSLQAIKTQRKWLTNAVGQMRSKQEQLKQAKAGRTQPHQRFILAQLLSQVESVEQVIKQFDSLSWGILPPFQPSSWTAWHHTWCCTSSGSCDCMRNRYRYEPV